MDGTGRLGDADGTEADILEGRGLIKMAPWAGQAGDASDGWGQTVDAAEVERRMGPLLGNVNALRRPSRRSLLVWLVNPHGGMTPYGPGGRYRHECRLSQAAALVAGGVADVVVLPEAHVDADGERKASKWVAATHGSEVRVMAAPTSSAAMQMELLGDGAPARVSSWGGILVLLSADTAACIAGRPTHTHFVAGRLIHMKFEFEEGPLHVVGMYGVSSPESSPQKVWIAAQLAKQLGITLRDTVGDAAGMVVTDENVARGPEDRATGKLQSYDDNESAPWRVLEAAGFIDVYRYKHPTAQEYTFVREGVPCSRIDKHYANRKLLQWQGGGVSGVRTAITSSTQPLSPDHRSVIVLWPGPFTPRTRTGGQGVVTISAVPRPARFEMTEATRARYLEAVAARAGALGAVGRRLQADVGGWPELARAMELLQLELGTCTPEAVDDAQRRLKGAVDDAELAHAVSVALDFDGGQLTGVAMMAARERARTATSLFLTEMHRQLRDAEREARAARPAKPKETNGVPEVSIAQLQSVIERWHGVVTGSTWEADSIDTLAAEVRRAGALLMPPDATAGRMAWEKWAAAAIPHAEMLLSRAGCSYRDGVWSGMDAVARAQRSQRLTTAEMFSDLKGKGGGGIDALMVDFDEETGEALPCMTHEGLARHVRDMLADWSSDKTESYAFTGACSRALFEISKDARGLTRARVGSEEAVSSRVASEAARLRSVASNARQV